MLIFTPTGLSQSQCHPMHATISSLIVKVTNWTLLIGITTFEDPSFFISYPEQLCSILTSYPELTKATDMADEEKASKTHCNKETGVRSH